MQSRQEILSERTKQFALRIVRPLNRSGKPENRSTDDPNDPMSR